MGLRSVPSIESAPDLTVDLGAFAPGASISFRAPKLADYMPSEGAFREVSFRWPSFPDTLIRQILLMSACYLRADDDPADLAPAADLARIADTNMGAFLHILGEFTRAFPQDFGQAVADAKNALPE